jgi:hypothetical protein
LRMTVNCSTRLGLGWFSLLALNATLFQKIVSFIET